MNELTATAQVRINRLRQVVCPHCGESFAGMTVKPLTSIPCPDCGASVDVPGKIGELLLTKILGRGSMAVVFEAIDDRFDRHVAVKLMIRGDAVQEAERLGDFIAEARTLSKIHHPNVVHVFNIGRHKGQPYIEMELVSGGEDVMLYCSGRKVLEEARGLGILIDIARGLDTACRQGMLHGDVKPQNILIAEEGTAKIVDFGLSRRAHKAAKGVIYGTPYYVAPERVRGLTSDARADIFSLGATLWHMLVGRPPYRGESVRQIVSARLEADPPDARSYRADLHPATARLLARMMAHDAALRPASYAQVVHEAQSVRAQVFGQV